MAEVRPFRNSERSTLKRCETRWVWGWDEMWRPNIVDTKLWMGTGIHLALAEWYIPGSERGREPVETWLEYCEGEEGKRSSAVYENEEAEWHDVVDMGVYMLEGYRELYGLDEGMTMIAPEMTFNLPIRHPQSNVKKITKRNTIAKLVGTFDGVYRDGEGRLWLLETKTAKGISTKHLNMDPQAGTYFYAATRYLRRERLIGAREELVGIMYNFLDKYARPDTSKRTVDSQGRYRNKPQKVHYQDALGSNSGDNISKLPIKKLEELADQRGLTVYGDVSAVQPRPLEQRFLREPVYRTRRYRQMMGDEIARDALRRQQLIEGTVLPTINPTRDCSWDCDFYNMCDLYQGGQDWEEYRDMAYHQEDMYEDHRDRKG